MEKTKVKVLAIDENKVRQALSLSPANIEWLFDKAADEQKRLASYVSASKIADDILTEARLADTKRKIKAVKS